MKPLSKIVEMVKEIPKEVTFIQNWKCGKCGDKVYGDEPNRLYESGLHTHKDDRSPCGYTTDFQTEGCGLTTIMGTETPEKQEALWREAADAAGR